MYTIKFDFPNLPKGAEIDITGFDRLFLNGETTEITKEEADTWRQVQAEMLAVETAHTLLETFKDNPAVTVTTKKEGDK